MKIKPFEYEDLGVLIRSHTDAQHRFRKYKGWLYIEFDDCRASFGIHRSDFHELLDGELHSTSAYKIRFTTTRFESLTWPQVLSQLQIWLRDHLI